MTLADLVSGREIIICCGSGGVGKTTVAASIALAAAHAGRKACVVTIDPAKRLADALGIETLTNHPKQITVQDAQGELWAMMLDTKGTFDDLVDRYAASPQQASAILSNALYRNISGALSGTQEYMAMEKLFELHQSQFDLVVVDTPPTRNALDFLDAPRRLTAFLDNRIFRVVIMPTRAYLKAVSVATQTVLRTLSRVVGAEVVGDAIGFFDAFQGMEQGFRDRASAVRDLLAAPETAFVLVTSPRPEAVEEASFFASKLDAADLDVDALVVNRLHPRFGGPPLTGPFPDTPLGRLQRNLADFQAVAAMEESHFADLAGKVGVDRVARVPFLADDVHDLDGLEIVQTHLMEAG